MRYGLLGLAFIFAIIWLIEFVTYQVAGFLIHVLLILAVVAFIAHRLRPRRTP